MQLDSAAFVEAIACATSKNGVADIPNLIDYNAWRAREGKSLIKDITFELRHHNIHCISVGSSFYTITGHTLEEFGRLFADLVPEMKRLWPNCPATCEPGERPKFGELRFKLFLALYRLRRYQSYSAMEVTWCVLIGIMYASCS